MYKAPAREKLVDGLTYDSTLNPMPTGMLKRLRLAQVRGGIFKINNIKPFTAINKIGWLDWNETK